MALKKGYCSKCTTKNELNRIFWVNSEAEHCFCPRCMAKLDPKTAIADYEMFIANGLLEAQRMLYQATDFYGAYCKFAEVLDIEPESDHARLGRIIALIYMSKLRKSKFRETAILLKTEATAHFHKMKDLEIYAKTLRKCFRAIDEYDTLFRKRLMVRKAFYSVDCLKLFIQRLSEIIDLKNLLIEELTFVNEKLDNEKIKNAIDEYKESTKNSQKELKLKYPTVDGTKYGLAKINDNGEIILGYGDTKTKPITHYRHHTLSDKDEKGKLIKDEVYPNNMGIARGIKITIPVLIALLVIALGLLVPYFIFMKKSLGWYFLIGSGVFLAAFVVVFVLRLTWKHKLKKRHHLID